MADNSLGKDRKSIEVSGRPLPAKVISPVDSFSKNQYNLTWTVDSFLRIEEYRILYRLLLVSQTWSIPVTRFLKIPALIPHLDFPF